jgi:hypothetical protein
MRGLLIAGPELSALIGFLSICCRQDCFVVMPFDSAIDMDIHREEISIRLLAEADLYPIRIALMIQDLHPLAD